MTDPVKTYSPEEHIHILLFDARANERPALMNALIAYYRVTLVATGEEMIEVIKRDTPAMVILDAEEKNIEYMSLLEEYERHMPVLLVGQHPDNEYVGEGFKRSSLKMWLEHTVVSRQQHLQITKAEVEQQQIQRFGDFISCSRQVFPIFQLLKRVVTTDVPILILGESGTGKELIARGIHELSGRKEHPFVAINCAAIPENLLETELFGFEKGAFTGATATKVGKLEHAGGGTVFLDEIGDMPLLTQAKMLRALQEHTIERVGGHQPIYFRARIVAATNKHLLEEIQRRTFREDLLYRLNTVQVELPPLRERREDIPLLIEHYLQILSQRYNKSILGVSPGVSNALQKYDWPGNVRELLNIMHHAVLLCDRPRIELKDLPPQFQHGTKVTILLDELGKVPMDTIIEQSIRELESQIITHVLEKFNYHKGRSAYFLGIDRKTLYRKMKALNIKDTEEEDSIGSLYR